MEHANQVQHRQKSLIHRLDEVELAPIVAVVLMVVLIGLTSINPFLGLLMALSFFLLVLVVPHPVLIVYGLIVILPLTDGASRGSVVPFLRLGQALLVLAAILFLVAKSSPQGKSRLTAIDLAFIFFFLTEAVFPVMALYLRGEHLDFTSSANRFGNTAPLQTLLGPIQYYVLYRIIVATISSKKQIVTVLRLTFTTSIIVSIIGILQKLVGPVRTFLDTYYPNILPGDPIPTDTQLRVSSTLGSNGSLAVYLCFVIILAFTCYTTRERQLKISGLLLASTLFIDSIALLLTGRFAGYFGVVIGAAVVFILLRRFPKWILFVLIGIVIALVIFQPFISYRWDNWFGGSGQGLFPTFAARITLWQELFLPAIGQHIFFGSGPSPVVLNTWFTEETQYLYLLLRGGLFYFFSYCILMITAIAACWRQITSKGEGLNQMIAVATLAILIVLNVINISAAFFTNNGCADIIWMLLGMVVVSGQFIESETLSTDKSIANSGSNLKVAEITLLSQPAVAATAVNRSTKKGKDA